MVGRRAFLRLLAAVPFLPKALVAPRAARLMPWVDTGNTIAGNTITYGETYSHHVVGVLRTGECFYKINFVDNFTPALQDAERTLHT